MDYRKAVDTIIIIFIVRINYMHKTAEEFRKEMQEFFSQSIDIYYLLKKTAGCNLLIMKVDNITSDVSLSLIVLNRLAEVEKQSLTPQQMYDYISTDNSMPVCMLTAKTRDDVELLMLAGFAVIYIEGHDVMLGVGIQAPPGNTVTEVSGEGNIKGSKLGFSQNLRVNMALLRQFIRSTELTFETGFLGGVNDTEYMLCYHKGQAPEKLLNQVKERIKNVNLPMVFDSGYLGAFIQKKQPSLFSATGSTERPATAAAKLCEGKVIIMVAGSPFALIYPYLFPENFQSLDDYSSRPYFASGIRLLKYVAFFIAVLLPGVFISIVNFTPELLPVQLMYKIAYSEQGTPLPLFVEAITVTVLLEIVREAGLRLPKQIGSAVSLVSALIVGDAAIQMGILSAPILIVIAFSALAAFVIPSLYEPIIILRVLFILAGGIGGALLVAGLFAIMLLNICGVHSFGIPFTRPVLPMGDDAFADGLIRSGTEKGEGFNINNYINSNNNE